MTKAEIIKHILKDKTKAKNFTKEELLKMPKDELLEIAVRDFDRRRDK